MRNHKLKLLLFIILLSGVQLASGQVLDSLTNRVNRMNDAGKYVQSVRLIETFMTRNKTEREMYAAQMLMADTYKRLFEYPKVFYYLNEAKKTARKSTANRQYFEDNIRLQEALAFFDIQEFGKSKHLMRQIVESNFRNLNCQDKSYIIMQLGYLDYLNGDYGESEKKYTKASEIMTTCSPCDLPVIYGKRISLYGKLRNIPKMTAIYREADSIASYYKIPKYNLYLVEVMRNTFEEMKEYKQAFHYFKIYEALNVRYNAEGYKLRLQELEVRYRTSEKQKAIEVQQATILSNKRLIAALFAAFVILVLMVVIVYVIQQRKKVIDDGRKTLLFARQLLNKTEDERKRIAGDLHDSINNELLLIRNRIEQSPQDAVIRIDQLMDNVRIISRNLHPVMFDEIGLKDSIEQLVDRVQEHNHFPIQSEVAYQDELPAKDALQLYRIIQESVNNILRYSNAVGAIIRLYRDQQKLILHIQDNGIGFDVKKALESPDSFGVRNMIERGNAIQGKTTIYSDKTGTLITVEVPISPKRIPL